MSDSNTRSENADRPSRSLNIQALKSHILTHRLDVALWFIRCVTVVFAFLYFIPIVGNSQSAYNKVLIANAAISALRLHQRLGRVQFTRQFMLHLLTEDSCHYLFYSLIFIYVTPVTLVLLPVVLFAILHASSYFLTMLDTLGHNAWWGARLLISIVEFQSRNILRLISFTEIVLMPFTVMLVLMGRAGLLTPFIYYHFLLQRYTSRRNPYTRNMFYELRVLFETTANKPSMPGIIKQMLLLIVNFTSKLAPPMTAAPPQQQ